MAYIYIKPFARPALMRGEEGEQGIRNYSGKIPEVDHNNRNLIS
jgi:hypothetical protein